MKSSKVFRTAVLTIAIGTPIAGLVGDMACRQPLTSTGVRDCPPARFPHPQIPIKAEAWLLLSARTNGSIRRRDGVALCAEKSPHRVLEQPASTGLRTLPTPRLGRRNIEQRLGGDRRSHAPEFGLEKNVDKRSPGRERQRSIYPIAVDNDHSYGCFQQPIWPADAISSMPQGVLGIITSARARKRQ